MLATIHRSISLPRRINLAKTVELSQAMSAIDVEASRLCGGLSAEQLSWCPQAGKWSIAQNLAHLRTTTEVFLPAVDAALETTRRLKLHSDGPFRMKFYGRLIGLANGDTPIDQVASAQCNSAEAVEFSPFGVGAFSSFPCGHETARRRGGWFASHGSSIPVTTRPVRPDEPTGVLFCVQRTFSAASSAGEQCPSSSSFLQFAGALIVGIDLLTTFDLCAILRQSTRAHFI